MTDTTTSAATCQDVLLSIQDSLAQLPADYADMRAIMSTLLAKRLRDENAPRYTLHYASEALGDIPPISWIVDKLFAHGSVSMVFGEPGSKKTWFALYAAVCVAMGAPCLGYATQKEKCLLVDEESGEKRLLRRLGAVMRGLGADEALPLAFTSLAQFNFLTDEDLAHLKVAIETTGARFVVIDAFADVMPGGDENMVKDTLPVLRGLRKIAEVTQSAIVIIHHAGKNGNYRGSSALKGAVDLLLEVVSKPDSPNVDFAIEKARDTEPFNFSATCTWTDTTFAMSFLPPKEKVTFSKSERYVLDYIEAHGDSTLDTLKANAAVCSENAARQAVYSLTSRHLLERKDDGKKGAAAIYGMVQALCDLEEAVFPPPKVI